MVNCGMFQGQIIAIAPTLSVTSIILRDSAKIHEEEAERANAEGCSKHRPALSFYSPKEAERAFRLFVAKERDVWIPLSENTNFRFRYNGHLIVATFIELLIFVNQFVFSGDLGRMEDLYYRLPNARTGPIICSWKAPTAINCTQKKMWNSYL